jgi:hypothetical protein
LALNRDMGHLGRSSTRSGPDQTASGTGIKDDSCKVMVSCQALCSWTWSIRNKNEDLSALCGLWLSDRKCGTQWR